MLTRPPHPLVADMVAAGALEAVDVEGWGQTAFKHPDARLPRRARARALVSPFDSVMWERDRVERVFGFRYRIEIYVPKPKRRYGYYVLPFLLDGDMVARVDLKADRRRGRLLVASAHIEDGREELRVAAGLAGELEEMARWLGLSEIEVDDVGDLAGPLAIAVS